MIPPLLPPFYFGSVEHLALLARHPRVVIDLGGHYERQSYRTRTSIVGPNGPQLLNVHIARESGTRPPLHAIGLSYTETWPQQHMHAIRSAYGQAPWAIHYLDAIEEVLLARHERLVDLLLATMRLALKWTGARTELELRHEHVADTSGLHDLRDTLHPKRALPAGLHAVGPYPQVFADRHGFVPRMSVIDLACNAGPAIGTILRGSAQ